MLVEMELYKPSISCEDGFLITLFINGHFVCTLHSFEMIKRKLLIMRRKGIYERLSSDN